MIKKLLGLSQKEFFKVVSFFVVLLAIPFSVNFLTTSPDVARMLGRPVGAAPGVNLETPNPVTPSIQGFSSNLSTGASTVSYPIDAPAGPGGLKPNLSLFYSSGAVDDIHVGVPKECHQSGCYDWTEQYLRQASWVGLGWNLGGLGYIARKPGADTEASREASKDDEFYLVFAGGSARLIKTDTGWETDPKLFLKIEHQQAPTNKPYTHDTAPWLITTPDGSKYYFGQPTNQEGFFSKEKVLRKLFPFILTSEKAFSMLTLFRAKV